MANIFKERFGKIPSENLCVGEGVVFGDLEVAETITYQVVRRTHTRLFIEKEEKNGETYYIDPTNGKRCSSIANKKPLKDFIPDVPEKISRKEIKYICRNLNGVERNTWKEYTPIKFWIASMKNHVDFFFQIKKKIENDAFFEIMKEAAKIIKPEDDGEPYYRGKAFIDMLKLATEKSNETEEHTDVATTVPCDRAFETNLTKEELEERGFFKPASKEIQEENKKITEKIVKQVKKVDSNKDDLSM